MSADEYALGVGDSVSHYRISRTLGAGGFGITYLADDLSLGRKIALKEFFPEDYARRRDDGVVVPRNDGAQGTFDWALESFSDEARTLARFSHPNIVRVNQLMTEVNGTAYIIMDYVPGRTLQACMDIDGPPDPERLLSIVRQLLDGCEAIHEHGILHRDINPSNVMMRGATLGEGAAPGAWGEGGKPVPILIDFGASRQLAAQQKRGFTAIATPRYSPPEQYSQNKTQTEASDIYALAATIHHMLTGSPPPSAAERHEEPLAIVPAQRAAAFRPEFLSGVLQGLQLSMNNRPQNIGEWRKLLGPLELAAQKGEPPPVLTRRNALIAGGVVLAGALGSAAVFALRGRREPLTGSARPLKVAWSKDFGPLEDDPLGQIAVTPNGAALAAHRVGDDGNYRMLSLLVDDAGAVAGQWIDDRPGGRAHAILPTADGGAFVGGTIADVAVLVRLDRAWKEVWRREVGSGAVKTILPTATGVVVGLEAPRSSGAPLISLGPTGDLVWRVNIEKGEGESAERIVKLAKGGYALLGSGLRARETTAGTQNESYVWVAMLDEQGKVRNRPQTTGLGAATGWSIVEVGDTLYVTGRTTDGQPSADPRLLMWAIDASGTELWARWDYPGLPSSGRCFALTEGGTLYLAGWSGSPHRMRFAQVGPKGDLVWDDSPQAGGGAIAAIGLAMRDKHSGFALATSQVVGNQNRLIVSKLTADA